MRLIIWAVVAYDFIAALVGSFFIGRWLGDKTADYLYGRDK